MKIHVVSRENTRGVAQGWWVFTCGERSTRGHTNFTYKVEEQKSKYTIGYWANCKMAITLFLHRSFKLENFSQSKFSFTAECDLENICYKVRATETINRKEY